MKRKSPNRRVSPRSAPAPEPSAEAAKATRKGKKTAGKAAAPAAAGVKPDPVDGAELPDEVFEFVRAIDHFKRVQGRPFPTWSEVLEVLKRLGYERRAG